MYIDVLSTEAMALRWGLFVAKSGMQQVVDQLGQLKSRGNYEE